jgi:hypothetical protein
MSIVPPTAVGGWRTLFRAGLRKAGITRANAEKLKLKRAKAEMLTC